MTDEHQPDADRWLPRLARWSNRLHATRLDGVAGLLLDVLEPLGPLGAQALLVAQPTLGLVVPREDIASLAHLLEAPGGVSWLRENLIGPDDAPLGEGERDGK